VYYFTIFIFINQECFIKLNSEYRMKLYFISLCSFVSYVFIFLCFYFLCSYFTEIDLLQNKTVPASKIQALYIFVKIDFLRSADLYAISNPFCYKHINSSSTNLLILEAFTNFLVTPSLTSTRVGACIMPYS
jgi:hypothetical protein